MRANEPNADDGFHAQKFHFSPVPLMALFGSFVVVLWAVDVLRFGRGDGYNLNLLGQMCVLAAAVVLAFMVFDRFSPVWIGPEGIDTYTGIGSRVRVRWEDVQGVTRLTLFPGCAFLMLKHGRSVFTAACVATFLKRPTEFYEALAAYAGLDHPAAVAMRRHL